MSDFPTFLLCEYVAQDKGNKFIVAGIYAGDIVVPEFPAKLLFAIYAEVRAPHDGDHTFKLEMRLDGNEFARIEGRIQDAEAGKNNPISMNRVELGTPDEVAISFWGSINDEEPYLIAEKKIMRGEPTA